MLWYFMRHAEAEDTSPDGDRGRKLTERGQERTRASALGLRKLDLQVDLILTSPLVRAVETAEIVANVLEAPVEQEPLLGSGFDLEGLAEIAERLDKSNSVMLVGHEPDFSEVIGDFIGDGSVEMKKGAVACVQALGIAAGAGTLLWLMNSKQTGLIGEK